MTGPELHEDDICEVCGSWHADDRPFGSGALIWEIDSHADAFGRVGEDFNRDAVDRYRHNLLRARQHLNALIEQVEAPPWKDE